MSLDNRLAKLDPFFDVDGPHRESFRLLREIALGCGLVEDVKWKHPCYTHQGKNICIFGHFSEGPRISFFSGVLLDDPDHLLRKIGQNTRAGRLVQFDSLSELQEKRIGVEALINNAKDLVERGVKVDFEKDRDDQEMPEALINALELDPEYQDAWAALTPGRQRGWLLHFNAARQEKTKTSRVEKARAKVLAGKGWNER